MSKILILIIGHLCNAPRPQKEAETLAHAGYDVTVAGVWFDEESAARDEVLARGKRWKFQPVVDLRPSASRVNSLKHRVVSRAAREAFRRFGIVSREALGYGVGTQLKFAEKFQADLTIVHSEAGLWVGEQLLKKGFRVGVDFEDWFSEDLLSAHRAGRPIKELKRLEKLLAGSCAYSLTTSHALAHAMSDAYDVPPPTVIYNSFPFAERERLDNLQLDRKNKDVPSLHWFSQTIGEGRGLETLMQALEMIDVAAEVHLRGNYSPQARAWLEPLIPEKWRERIFFHKSVPNDELLSRIGEHDIGLALEVSDIPSRNLTVTNKLFQYLQGGLAIVATDTAGQREIYQAVPCAMRLCRAGDAKSLARKLVELVRDTEELNSAKRSALTAAREKFCWERQESILLDAIENALSKGA